MTTFNDGYPIFGDDMYGYTEKGAEFTVSKTWRTRLQKEFKKKYTKEMNDLNRSTAMARSYALQMLEDEEKLYEILEEFFKEKRIESADYSWVNALVLNKKSRMDNADIYFGWQVIEAIRKWKKQAIPERKKNVKNMTH